MNQRELLAVLSYNPASGVFVRISGAGRKGVPIDSLNTRGYVTISVNAVRYLAHRLAWLAFYGEWPTGNIDHINGDKSDNRIENLRDVTQSINLQNRRAAQSNNVTTGLLGVTYDKRHGNFMARITVNRRQMSLGRYKTAEEAQEAYIKAKRALHVGCTI